MPVWKLDNLLNVGYIFKPHSYLGTVKVVFYTAFPKNFKIENSIIYLNKDGYIVPFFLEQYKFNNSTNALFKILDIDNEGQAKEISGLSFALQEETLPQNLVKDLIWYNIEGYRVLNSKSRSIGTVSGVDSENNNIYLEIQLDKKDTITLLVSYDVLEHISKRKKTIKFTLSDEVYRVNDDSSPYSE
jgi:16S rRNA processing protein RimM